MNHAISTIEIALSISSALMPIIGLAFLWVARRSLGGLLLGVTVFLWGLHFLVFGTGMAMVAMGYAVGAGAPFVVAQVLYLLMAGSMVAFAIVYPGIVPGRAHKLGLSLTGVGVAVLVGYALVAQGAHVSVSGPTETYWRLQNLAFYLALLVAVVLLGRRWLDSTPGARRTQISWGLIPFVFWSLMEASVWSVYPLVFGPRSASTLVWADPLTVVAHAAVLSAAAFGLYLAGVASVRVISGDPTPDERALSFATLYLIPLTLLPLLDPVYGTGEVPSIQPLVMNLFVFLVVYAVARYDIVDLDLKLKWGVEKSTLVGAFGVVFLVVSEAVEALLNVEGTAFGIVAAVAIGLLFRHLEAFSERVADRLMPGVEGTERYLDERRGTIYRAQAETLLADGQVTSRERQALDRLREELELETVQAERIEAEALAR